MNHRSINYTIENSIVNYLSNSYYSSGSYLNKLQQSGSNVMFYAGIGNVDISDTSSAVVVNCINASEVAYNTRVYAMDVEVNCGEMAYDTAVLGQLPMYVFNEFVSSSVAAANFTNNNIAVYQCQIMGFDQNINGDAIHSKGVFRIVGGLI